MPGPDECDPDALLPDYVAECDEHLNTAGRLLLDIEVEPSRLDRAGIDSLFRSFHSVKGLSGMVGLAEAERLAHQMEGYLGAIRRGRTALSPDGVAALVEGVRSLERVIAARAGGLPLPPVDVLVGRIASLIPDGPEGGSSAAPNTSPIVEPQTDPFSRANAALRQGASVWRVRFTPTAALAERGLTVNTVRERLRAAGEIVYAVPAVTPGGVTFTFLLAVSAGDLPADLQDAGLAVERYEPPAEVTEPVPSATPRVTSLTPANLVRVELGRLDELMRSVGELVVTRARLDNGLGRVAAALPPAELRELRETSQVLERQLRDLREGVMRVRMVPFRDLFARMRFVVRDLARETGQEIDLHLSGEETEVDKFVVERLAAPLLHLIRNAVSHGLEPPTERAAAGKPPRGRLDLRAAAAGGAIRIEVEDDGRGIDPERVFAQARAAGLVAPDASPDPAALLDLLCSPGFSTRDGTDRGSGRGVGMDVVAGAVEALGGTLTLDTRPGCGTRFTARLPLTLAIADGLVVTVGGQMYVVPQAAVREVVEVQPDTPVLLENNELLPHRGVVLPLLRLADLFGLDRPAGAFVVLVVGDGSAVALAADRVLGVREVVVRPLADPLVQVAGFAAATELGDGRAVLILDAARLARTTRAARRPTA